MPPRLEQRIVPKTAAYSILLDVDRAGTIFTNRGASGAVTFTLPSIGAGQRIGTFFDFLVVADQNVTVAAPAADTLIAFNDTAADSIALSTAGNKIGGYLRALWDGTSWVAFNLTNNTLTVNT